MIVRGGRETTRRVASVTTPRVPSLPTNSFIMVSYNVEEAVFMADRVIVMSPRPGTVIGKGKADIPRPRARYLRDEKYFSHVDEVLALLEKGKRRHPAPKCAIPPSEA